MKSLIELIAHMRGGGTELEIFEAKRIARYILRGWAL